MGIQKIYYPLAVLLVFFFSFAPIASGQDIGDKQNGRASWYGAQYHGKPTSSGEVYNRHKLTAAHNELPLGSIVKVTNKATGESVVVKINDRGPFSGARIIDLSEAAARKLHYHQQGLADVTVEVVELPEAFLASKPKPVKSEAKEVIAKEVIPAAKETKAIAAVTPAQPVQKAPAVASATKPTNVSTIPVTAPVTPTLEQTQFFAIQAGSFGSLSNAEAQVEKMRKMYQKMPIALVEETINGQKVHRILAGRFISKASAEQARQDLGKKGIQGLVRSVAEPATATAAMASAAPL